MTNLWRELVAENPMNVEIRRTLRRSTRVSGGTSQSVVAIVIFLIAYSGLILLVINMAGMSSGRWVVGLFYCLVPLTATLSLHGSVAGERERRTWDMLMVAPVTHAQVIAAKFLAGLALQGVLAVLLFIPAAILTLTNTQNVQNDPLSIFGVVWLMIVGLAFGAFCSALTMLVSARVKRSFLALGVALGTLVILYIFLPALLATGGSAGDIFLIGHPATPIAEYGRTSYYGSERVFLELGRSAIPCFLFHLAFTAVFLVWTIRTVAFADNEVKFLPSKKAANS